MALPTLRVDFNCEDERGLIPAVVRGVSELEEGDLVQADDGEGTRCKALVMDVRHHPRRGLTVYKVAINLVEVAE